MWATELERFRAKRRRLSTVSARESTHNAQASRAAVRVLIPPTPRSWSLAPSVTTPLYNTTVSQALRQTLRGKGLNDIDPHHQPRGHAGWRRGCGGGGHRL